MQNFTNVKQMEHTLDKYCFICCSSCGSIMWTAVRKALHNLKYKNKNNIRLFFNTQDSMLLYQ